MNIRTFAIGGVLGVVVGAVGCVGVFETMAAVRQAQFKAVAAEAGQTLEKQSAAGRVGFSRARLKQFTRSVMVAGALTNLTQQPMRRVVVAYRLTDDRGIWLADALDQVEDIAPGEVWNYRCTTESERDLDGCGFVFSQLAWDGGVVKERY